MFFGVWSGGLRFLKQFYVSHVSYPLPGPQISNQMSASPIPHHILQFSNLLRNLSGLSNSILKSRSQSPLAVDISA